MKTQKLINYRSITIALCSMFFFVQCDKPNGVEDPTQSASSHDVLYVDYSTGGSRILFDGRSVQNRNKSARVDPYSSLTYSFYGYVWQQCADANTGEATVVFNVQNPTSQNIDNVKLIFSAQAGLEVTPLGGSGGTFTLQSTGQYEWDLGTMGPSSYYTRQVKVKVLYGVEKEVVLYQTSPSQDTQITWCEGQRQNIVWNQTGGCGNGVPPNKHSSCP